MTLLRLLSNSALIVMICASGAFVFGQDGEPAAPVVPPAAPAVVETKTTTTTTSTPAAKTEKKQSINFEDELVEGTAQKPEFFYLFQKKNFNYKRLIRLRENFIPEMRRTAEDVQRLRGGR